jgi:hypothetical protein
MSGAFARLVSITLYFRVRPPPRKGKGQESVASDRPVFTDLKLEIKGPKKVQ